jgi:hypothetical protein
MKSRSVVAQAIVLVVVVGVIALACASVAAASPSGVMRVAPGDLLWDKTLPRPSTALSMDGFRVATAPTGDVYVAATVDRPDTDLGFMVIRYTSAGTRKWIRYFDPAHTQSLDDIATDRYGNVILCGRTDAVPGGGVALDGVVVKFSRAGTKLWSRRVASATGDSDVRDIAVDRSRNVYAVGTCPREGSGYDWITVKYSPGGKLLWQRFVSNGAIKWESAEAVAVGPDGRVYVAGATTETGGAGSDLCAVRYSADGHRDWLRTQGMEMMDDWAADIAVGTTGVCVVGQLPDQTRTYGTVWKLTRGGVSSPLAMDGVGEPANVQYKYTLAGIDGAGNVYAAGKALTFVEYMLYVRRIRPDGTKDYAFDGGGTGPAEATGLAVTSTGRVYASGTIHSAISRYNVCVLGRDSAWTALFDSTWNSPGDGSEVAQDGALGTGGYYVVGMTGADMLLLKYAR